MKKIIVVLLWVLIPAVVFAHVYLRETAPEDGATLDSPPAAVTMTFVGSLEPAFSKVEVFGPDGEQVSGKTEFHESDSVMEVSLEDGLSSGQYTVNWLCVSLDGHKVKGSFSFSVK